MKPFSWYHATSVSLHPVFTPCTVPTSVDPLPVTPSIWNTNDDQQSAPQKHFTPAATVYCAWSHKLQLLPIHIQQPPMHCLWCLWLAPGSRGPPDCCAASLHVSILKKKKKKPTSSYPACLSINQSVCLLSKPIDWCSCLSEGCIHCFKWKFDNLTDMQVNNLNHKKYTGIITTVSITKQYQNMHDIY